MPETSGNPLKIKFEKAQYLFRVYHTPITESDVFRLKGEFPANPYQLNPWTQGYELNHNDHLFSIPATTEAIVDTANRLAYAEALLYVESKIHFIAVWQVESAQRITKGSPTVILTPWATYPDQDYQPSDGTYLFWQLGAVPAGPAAHEPLFYQVNDLRGTFASFDLIPYPETYYIADRFIVLDVARQTASGPASKQWFKGVLGIDDYYFDHNGVIKLVPFGSACLTRFEWFQATLEEMKYTHSGWTLNPDGSIKLGTLKLTKRVANLAIDAAQRRRMFLQRSATVEKVYKLWWETVMYIGDSLRWTEQDGFPRYVNLSYGEGYEQFNYPFAHCDTVLIRRVLDAVAWFLNVLAIASGSDSLATFAPARGGMSQQYYYNRVIDYLNGNEWTTEPEFETVPELATSISFETFWALQDLLGAVWRKMYDYSRAGDFTYDGRVQAHGYSPEIEALYSVKVHNAWATNYETAQGHCQAMFSLLFTWQYQYQPYEATRNPQPVDDYKTRVHHENVYSEFGKEYRQRDANTKAARLEGRINEEVPHFTPPRTWSVTIPMPAVEAQLSAAIKAAEIAAYNAKLAQIADDREAARQARAAKHEQERQALLAQIESGGGANPLDPWDHRNWERKSFWLTPIHENDVIEFAANALNTPDEATVAEEVFHLNPKIINGLRRLEPLIKGVKDVVYPHHMVREVITRSLVKRAVKEVGKNYISYAEDKIKSAEKDRVLKDYGAENPAWQPREFWPQDEPDITVDTVPDDPFISSSTDFGGGGSGGGGGEAKW